MCVYIYIYIYTYVTPLVRGLLRGPGPVAPRGGQAAAADYMYT